MKYYKQIIFILIVFLKTETLFSENNLFNVNNIKLEKKNKITTASLTDKAIQLGFNELITRILLIKDVEKVSELNFSAIKQLVAYYQIINIPDDNSEKELINFSVTFDKDKIHDLFYKKGILYSKISDKDLYTLPILISDDKVNIFNNNFFYEQWNKFYDNDLIEFILPLENIEIIKNINDNKDNLINLDIKNLFQEYSNKNLSLILIEDNKTNIEKIYLQTIIQGKRISKSINVKKQDVTIDKFYEQVIILIKKELINLVKSKNLIDIRTPSFLNAKLDLNKNSNLVILKSRIKNIGLIENIYVQEFNKEYMNIRIKYLGKLEKIISQLKREKIYLELIGDQWLIKTL